MHSTETGTRVSVTIGDGALVATADVPVQLDRAFRALASREVTEWWVRPGVFDVREWHGDVRVGGAWEATGVARGQSYTLEGQFLTVDAPRELSHTWVLRGAPGQPTTVTYSLVPHNEGTRITLRHSGFTSPQALENTAAAWQTSFDRLVEILAEQ